MNIDIAKNLADRRRAMGLSQEGLAQKLGVSRQAVSKWERSESSPDTDNLIALAQLYGVSLDDLLYAEVDCPREGWAAEEPADGAAAANGAASAGDAAASDGASPAAAAAGGETAAGTDAAGSSADGKSGKVHIGLDGIHVEDGADYVHVSWREGVHVIDGSGHGDTVHVGWDGVRVNDERYDNIHEARRAHLFMREAREQSSFLRTWRWFPFPLLVIIAYLLVGFVLGQWGLGLFMGFAIPLYYLLGSLIATRKLGNFVASAYPIGVVAWFCYMAFVLNQAHPAWIMFLTIPLVEWLVLALKRQYGKQKAHERHRERVIDIDAQ